MPGSTNRELHPHTRSLEDKSCTHILAVCCGLVQIKWLELHNNALKILFFEVLRSLEERCYSRINRKPSIYENERATAYWDVPLYAESNLVTANRIDATVVDKDKREVSLIEMSCPWIENREAKAEEKTTK